MFEVAGITLAKNLDGRLELLANVTRNGRPDGVWRRWESLEGGWQGWESLGKPGNGVDFAPAVTRNDDGRLEAAIVGVDGYVYHAWQRHPGRGWTGWQAMHPPGEQIRLLGRTAFARNRDGRLELFAMTGEGTVWHRWQTTPAHGPWSPWSTLGNPGGSADEGMTAVRNQDGHLELFSLDGQSAIHCWQTRPGSDQWSAWSPLGAPTIPRGVIALDATAPKVARDQGGRLELLARGEIGVEGVWHRRQSEASHGPWSQWSPLGRPDGEYGRIAVGAHADGRLVLVVGMHAPADTPVSQLEPVSLLEQTAPNGDAWSPWRSFPNPGPDETENPALTLDADRRLQVWLRVPGTTGLFRLWQKRPNGDEWDATWIGIDPPPEPDEPEQPSYPPH
jgi:hypothetical protein